MRFLLVTALSKMISCGLVLDGTSPGGSAALSACPRLCRALADPPHPRTGRPLPMVWPVVSTFGRMRRCACARGSVRYRHAFVQGIFDRTPETLVSLPATGVSPFVRCLGLDNDHLPVIVGMEMPATNGKACPNDSTVDAPRNSLFIQVGAAPSFTTLSVRMTLTRRAPRPQYRFASLTSGRCPDTPTSGGLFTSG